MQLSLDIFLIICEMLSGIFTKFHAFLVEIVS
jgi:hypothetical protein